MKTENPLDIAVGLLGGVVCAAEVLNLKSYQVIQQWRRTQVPAERCPDIEAATGGAVTCEELRPDVNWAVVRSAPVNA